MELEGGMLVTWMKWSEEGECYYELKYKRAYDEEAKRKKKKKRVDTWRATLLHSPWQDTEDEQHQPGALLDLELSLETRGLEWRTCEESEVPASGRDFYRDQKVKKRKSSSSPKNSDKKKKKCCYASEVIVGKLLLPKGPMYEALREKGWELRRESPDDSWLMVERTYWVNRRIPGRRIENRNFRRIAEDPEKGWMLLLSRGVDIDESERHVVAEASAVERARAVAEYLFWCGGGRVSAAAGAADVVAEMRWLYPPTHVLSDRFARALGAARLEDDDDDEFDEATIVDDDDDQDLSVELLRAVSELPREVRRSVTFGAAHAIAAAVDEAIRAEELEAELAIAERRDANFAREFEIADQTLVARGADQEKYEACVRERRKNRDDAETADDREDCEALLALADRRLAGAVASRALAAEVYVDARDAADRSKAAKVAACAAAAAAAAPAMRRRHRGGVASRDKKPGDPKSALRTARDLAASLLLLQTRTAHQSNN